MATKKKEETKKTPKKEVKVETSKKIEKLNENKKQEQNPIVSLIELIAIILAVVIILVFFKDTIIWNITTLLLILSVLIFVHEGGHFIVGKKCGVHIYEFALGMGPKIIGFRRKNDPTEYTLRAFPIGGYCALAGEEGEDDESLPKNKFMCNKSKLQRAAILVAGVTMNLILALVLLFSISFFAGSNQVESVIAEVEAGSPAEEAGIIPGDKVVGFNGYKIRTWDKLSIVAVFKNDKEYLEYKIQHKDGKVETYKIIPKEYVEIDGKKVNITEENTLDKISKDYKIKKEKLTVRKYIGISQSSKINKGFVNALKYAGQKFCSIVETMFLTIWSLFTGKIGLSALSGPVGMYKVVDKVAAFGLSNIVYLTAYLSINLAVINILPFPAFDGGRLLFVVIEAITRKKVDAKVENWFHTIGFMLILVLIAVITFNDIFHLFG